MHCKRAFFFFFYLINILDPPRKTPQGHVAGAAARFRVPGAQPRKNHLLGELRDESLGTARPGSARLGCPGQRCPLPARLGASAPAAAAAAPLPAPCARGAHRGRGGAQVPGDSGDTSLLPSGDRASILRNPQSVLKARSRQWKND